MTTKNIDYEKVEIAYHEAQIKACKRTIQGHEERIDEIKNPPETEDVEKTDTEKQTDEQEEKETNK